MARLNYKYKLKKDNLLYLWQKIQYDSPTSKVNQWAKSAIKKLVLRVGSDKLKPSSDGDIIVSGSDGDKISKSCYVIDMTKLTISTPTPNLDIDCSNAWWHDI